jgi:hypothetical protein
VKSPFRTNVVLGVLGALAAANLAAGIWLSSRPTHLEDLHAVADWARAWVIGGNPYAPLDSVVDYPPWALVALSPLTLIASGWLGPFWVMTNVALLAALIARLVRLVDEPGRIQLALALLLAATASARTLGQFSLLCYLLAIYGAFAPSRAIGALCVGLSLIKPQIGGVVLCWWLLRREWARAGLAAAVPVALAGLFALRAAIDPVTLLQQYGRALTAVHGAMPPLTGHTEIRAWLVGIWPGAASLAVSGVLAVIFLLPAVVSWRPASGPPEGGRHDPLEVLALCGCASLLALRHLSYDFILLWPALLAWRVPPVSARASAGGWVAGFLALSAMLVIEPPAWARLAASHGFPASILAVTETDRYLTLATWLALSIRLVFASRRTA